MDEKTHIIKQEYGQAWEPDLPVQIRNQKVNSFYYPEIRKSVEHDSARVIVYHIVIFYVFFYGSILDYFLIRFIWQLSLAYLRGWGIDKIIWIYQTSLTPKTIDNAG